MKLDHVSASQVENFRRCQRYWYLQKVLGRKVPASKSQKLGTLLHARIEAYLKGNPVIKDEHYPLVAVTLGSLPTPGKDLLIEHAISFPAYSGGPKFEGIIDLVDPRTLKHAYVSIGDHKSTKSFNYCKTEKELKYNNVQALAYSKWAFSVETLPWFPVPPAPEWERLARGEFGEVGFFHNYIRTSTPGNKRVDVRLSRGHVNTEWEKVSADVEKMVSLAAQPAKVHLSVIPNKDACDDFGGCYFKNICTDLHGVKKTKGEEHMSAIKEKLASMGISKGPEVAPPMVQTVQTVQVVQNVQSDVTGATGVLPPDAPAREQPNVSAPPETKKKRKVNGEIPKFIMVGSQITTPEAAVNFFRAMPMQLSQWLDPILRVVADEMNVSDPGLIEFGKGRHLVAAAVRERLDTLPQISFARGGNRYDDVVVEEAERRGDIVVINKLGF